MKLKEGEVNFIKVESLSSDGQFLPGKIQKIDLVTHESLGRSKLQKGDILYSIAGSIGRCAIVPEELLPANTNQAIAIIRPIKGAVDTEYLFYFLNNKVSQKDAFKRIVQSVQTNLSLAELGDLAIDLPDLAIQRSIAATMKSFDSKIELNKKKSKTIANIAGTIFRSWFIDLDPVVARMNGHEPKGMDSATASLFPSSMAESDSVLIPDGWKLGNLGDVLSTLESGKRPRGGAQKSGVPSIGAESIRGIGQFNYAATKYIPRDFFDGMPSGKVLPYDVLIYKDGAGAGSYVSMFGEGFPFKEFAINEHVFLARSTVVPQTYLFYWLNQEAQKALMIQLAQKSAQPGLNQQDTKSIPILVPSTEVLDAFSECVEPLIKAIMSYSLQSTTLESIREGLLPKLLSGELQIPKEMLAS
jgi:type I restriction enzyme S subunit